MGIWNLTQHSDENRAVFAEAGAIQRLGLVLARSYREVTSSRSPPWAIINLLLGALANLAMSCGEQLQASQGIVEVGEHLMCMERVAPEIIVKQATRLICNVISAGHVMQDWQENGYAYRSSAPRDAEHALVISA